MTLEEEVPVEVEYEEEMVQEREVEEEEVTWHQKIEQCILTKDKEWELRKERFVICT